MIQTISERVFRNGGITRKDINNVIVKTLRNLDSYRGFQKVRDLVSDFGKATRKRDRGAILVALGAIGWNGIFDAGNIAMILLGYEDRNRGVSLALDKLARWETDYKANMNDVKVLRLGAKQVLQKKWKVTFAVTARQIEMQVEDGAKTPFHFPVSVEGTGNIYAFLKMLLLVRPMLMPRRIKFTFATLETIKGVWSMGESKIAYGDWGCTGAEMLKKDKEFKNYFGDYALPDEVKEVILDCLKDAIGGVQYATGHDDEGNSYNSLKYKPIPDKGVWLGARRSA